MVRRAVLAWLLSALPALADPPVFAIITEQSTLGFDVIENGAKVSGAFLEFSGTIAFDPKALEQSRVVVEVKLASVTSETEKMAETLAMRDWFDTIRHPKATFISQNIRSLGGDRYEAMGTLTIKGVAQPVTLPFTLIAYDPVHAMASGAISLSRTAFTVGWSDTRQVEDEVKVAFSVIAKAK